ncbi:MAG: DNA/RNA nuclease SfsA, partial [Kiloniellaceae bacterium]
LGELGDAAEAGHRAVMFFLIQRADCTRLEIAGDIDPVYDAALHTAIARGVEVLCYSCTVNANAIELHGRLPVALA